MDLIGQQLKTANLPPEVRQRLRQLLQTRTFKASEFFFSQGDGPEIIYFIIRGKVKITRVTPEGTPTLLCIRGPGEYFCPITIMDGRPQLGDAVALTNGMALWARREPFLALCREYPALLTVVQSACLAEVRALVHRMDILASGSVQKRVAAALLAMVRHQREQGDPTPELRVTHQEIAAMIGTARESVSRTLSRFADHGLVTLRRGRIVVHDWQLLAQLVADGEEQNDDQTGLVRRPF